MPEPAKPASWDFAPVYNLISSLRDQDAVSAAADRRHHDYSLSLATAAAPADDGPTLPDTVDSKARLAALGDFSRLWTTLGVAPPPPAASIPTFEASTAGRKEDAYASDGPLYYPPSSKSVRWRDQEKEDAELADTQPDSPPSDEGLTKNQRKKRNRKARKQAEIEAMAANLRRKRVPRDAGSGDDTDVSISSTKAVNTRSPPGPEKPLQTAKASKPTPVVTKPATGANPARKTVTTTDESEDGFSRTQRPDSALRPAQVTPLKPRPQPANPTRSQTSSNAHQKSVSTELKTPLPHSMLPVSYGSEAKKHWPIAQPYDEYRTSVVPGVPWTEPRRPNAPIQPVPAVQQRQGLTHVVAHHARHEIKPLELKDTVDRNWSLFSKLMKNFPDDRKWLLSPLQLSINKPSPNGIHVFVDSSNILIGFHQFLKRARGIPDEARCPRVYPSFHALALLLERRRPVAKRVLVGSPPRVAAYDDAESVGYDVHLLERVWKAKELTERQRKFALRDAAKSGYSSGYESSDGNGVLPPQQPKWVEQGVDEIVHLKMAESLIDVDVPEADRPENASRVKRPTMVLATGDAAEAEYSSGFLKMVTRALQKGWNVEVAAWTHGMSNEYNKLQKQTKWKGRFKLIILDTFAEEMFPSETDE